MHQPKDISVKPVQLPTRTKVFADIEAPAHSVVEHEQLNGRDKILTYDQVEDVLSNKPGPIVSYYLTIEQSPEIFSVQDFLPDLQEARQELLDQFTLVKQWYDAQELLISGVNHDDLQNVLKKLQTTGISRKVLDDSLKADNAFTKYVGDGEDENIYTIRLSTEQRNEEVRRCKPEHAISVLLEDLIEKVALYDVAEGNTKSFSTAIFQPSMAIMFLLRAAIPPDHYSLKGVATDSTAAQEQSLERMLSREITEIKNGKKAGA